MQIQECYAQTIVYQLNQMTRKNIEENLGYFFMTPMDLIELGHNASVQT